MISIPDHGANPAPPAWTPSQVADFAILLELLGIGTTRWLLEQMLGTRGLADAGKALDIPRALATFTAEALDQAGLMSSAVGRLRQEAQHNAHVILRLDRLARGVPIDSPELQAIWNKNEPFFNSKDFARVVARGSRTVCAVGLDDPAYGIVGSGFLIGPDLVLTNHHAIEPFVDVHADGTLTEKPGAGSIYCYFDYFAGPVPPVPPASAGNHPSIAVRCAPGWLVHGRPLLPFDGSDKSPKDVPFEFDYAVLRLSKPMGRLPARSSGGSLRGWLSLPEQIDTVGVQKRVIVFQHPNRAPQQLDVGTYERMDLSNTRVWYGVNTSVGSSGGAAVDSDGQLFALHNAAVTRTGTKGLNQGIRIDVIKHDLSANAMGCLTPPPPDEDPLGFWSLTDNLKDPQPVLGRMDLRNYVSQMMQPSSKRVLVVTGPASSGVRFTKRIVRRIVGTVPVVEFTATALARITPADFVRTIVDEIGVVGHNAGPVPSANATENTPRWLRLDLPIWLAKALGGDPRQQARYPAWIVINTITEPGEKLLWADLLKDLVSALAGAHDAGQRAIDLPQLRWLFLARAVAPLPIVGVDRHEEDLTVDTTSFEDFADCMAAAWRSVEKEVDAPRNLLIRMARAKVADSPESPPRVSLARYVHDIMDDGAEP
jgi:hypothetical protein